MGRPQCPCGVPFDRIRVFVHGLGLISDDSESNEVESNDPEQLFPESFRRDGRVLSLTIVTDILATLVSLV